MNTAFLLMAQFNKAVIPIKDICDEYFGLSEATAKNYAAAGKLPIPAFRAGKSNKSTWMVNVTDLAEYLDQLRDQAKKDHIHSPKAA
ncbi:pyocin activator PrtN family protein [Shewanella holmiensis]|uniref:Pyocin activator PrtN family protein n=1 Tax=Shewanella holmiensis TaxID=2952222 RepID=A0A9X2WNG1_9GAMM|nr:pyocin activator PrtN family protein [Shewanella holmiensis]MCT7942419.1 pyocin activator PrtN family protein [Shewanella holmiensis]